MLENGLNVRFEREDGSMGHSPVMPLGLYRRTEDTKLIAPKKGQEEGSSSPPIKGGASPAGSPARVGSDGVEWGGAPAQMSEAYTGMRFVFTKPGPEEVKMKRNPCV